MDKLDFYLNNINIKDLNVPLSYTNTIKNTLYKNKYSFKYNITKIAAIFALVLCTGSIVVFATTKFFNLHSFNFNDSAINKAFENGYTQNINMDYITMNDVSFKVDFLLFDTTNIDLVFNFKFGEDISSYQGFSISDLLITDENNNQLFLDTEEVSHQNSFATSMGWQVLEKDNHSLKQLLFLKSNRFPKSKIMNIKFTQIVLYNVNNGKPFTKNIDGNWNIEIDISNKFAKRTSIIYEISPDNNINDFDLLDAQLLDSGFLLKFKTSLLSDTSTIKLLDESNVEYSIIYSDTEYTSKEIQYIVEFNLTKYDYKSNLKLIIQNNSNDIYTINLIPKNYS